MRYQTGESADVGGDFVQTEGSYHFVVDSVTEEVTNRDGTINHDIAFEAVLKVAAGTAPGENGKLLTAKFWAPRPSDKNDGELAKLKIDRFLLAVNLLTVEQINGQEVEVDVEAAKGRQLVAELHRNKKNYLEIKFGNIYHVDDPAVSGVPKNEECLSLLRPEWRKISQQPAQQVPSTPMKASDI